MLSQGIEEFNRRRFFECHEVLEAVWRAYAASDRECIQGIIQIAVGYYHHLRGNRKGAVKLLASGLERVRRFTPECFGFDLGTFSDAVSTDLERLKAGGENGAVQLRIPAIEPFSN